MVQVSTQNRELIEENGATLTKLYFYGSGCGSYMYYALSKLVVKYIYIYIYIIKHNRQNFAVATLSFTRLGDHQATDR